MQQAPNMLSGPPKLTPIMPHITAKPAGASLMPWMRARCLVVSELCVVKSASAARHSADWPRVKATYQHDRQLSQCAAGMVQAQAGSVHD